MTEARRPRLITALSIIQMVLAAIYLGGIVNLCYLAATANGQNAADVAKEVRGLLIGAAFSGSLAFGSVIAALGLWWTDLFTMHAHFLSTRTRPRETRTAAYFATTMFHPFATLADHITNGGLTDIREALSQQGWTTTLYS